MEYEIVIGLEVHVQLSTQSKIFCGCRTKFGQPPNSQVCPVCLGLPGSLPVLNERAFEYAIKVALALNCEISQFVKFDRKNYFYPDLPKNFQISQYDLPFSHTGYLYIRTGEQTKRVGIRRVHLEEDAGKLLHQKDSSLIDFNRCGIPLLEIVSEPELGSPDEAYEYLTTLKAILRYLGVSNCNMEEGSLRVDANVSVRPKGSTELGTKIELKNMNSFKAVKSALEFEANRLKAVLSQKDRVAQETRLWDADKGLTVAMRFKEESFDYRYFPEPDLVPFVIERETVEEIRKTLPELPDQRSERFITDYKLSEYDARVLIKEPALANYFEDCVRLYNRPKMVANWIITELLNQLNTRKLSIEDSPVEPTNLVDMLKLLDSGEISGRIAKDVLTEMFDTGKDVSNIIEEKGLVQISDKAQIEKMVERAIKENPKTVEDFRKGRQKALIFLVGQVMSQTRGKANPKIVNEILKEKLGTDAVK